MSGSLRLGTGSGRGALLAATLASGMAFLDGTIVNVALPHLGADLGASLAGLQWTVNGYMLTLAAFVLLGGSLGDRYGRRRVFVIGVLWFTAASVLCGLAANVEWLIAARALQGLGAALLVPGSLALLQASFHPDERGKAIGAWTGLSGVATAAGPFVGGWLIDALTWRAIFFLNVPLALIAVFAAVRWVPESRAPRAERFDVAGALLAAAGLAGITYALIESADRGFSSWSVLLSVAVGVVASVAFVLVERHRGPAAMLPLSLFASRLFSALNVYTVAVYAALGGLSFFLVVYLQNVAGFSAVGAGASILPATVLMLAGSSWSGALATRLGPRPQLTAGPLVAAAGLLLLRRVGSDANFWTDVLPGTVVFGAGLTLLVAPLTAAVLGAVDDEQAGVASGVNNAAARAGGLLAVAALPLLVGLSGTAYEQPDELAAGFRGAMLWCAGLLAAGAVLGLVLVHRPGVQRAAASERG
ncbi:MFS transporter [Phytohabitans sp. ZYX-F-186]|uniref:MFS transporter n=1 Tax=Phytohabitans maris TaxID=3071409 RepID=A0ABU0ZIK9_9ACTN|nr:MFS transporter [Phytohabitans sp. ZYX-F-186]MDQ7906884.1 MFS transporter [Phytohabitans sp. ZYX-F-186]